MGVLVDVARAAVAKILLIGEKGTPAQEATICEGVPTPDTWYRLIDRASNTVGHSYSCGGHAEYKHPGGPFEWLTEYTCGCDRKHQLKSWLERLATKQREIAGYRAAGLSDNPTLVELEMAKKLKRTVNIRTGPITEEELKAAYSTVGYRYANPSEARSGQPRVIDANANDGEYQWSGSGSQTTESDPFAGGAGFSNPRRF